MQRLERVGSSPNHSGKEDPQSSLLDVSVLDVSPLDASVLDDSLLGGSVQDAGVLPDTSVRNPSSDQEESQAPTRIDEAQLRRLVAETIEVADDDTTDTTEPATRIADATVVAVEPTAPAPSEAATTDRPRALTPTTAHGRHLKRALDIAGSVGLLVGLSPVLAACAVAVRVGSPGPILFRQERVGLDGRTFTMFKLRTMYVDADSSVHEEYVRRYIAGEAQATNGTGNGSGASEQVFKLVGDRRVTPAGRWLRKLSLDELPQLFNVLRGEMSLVGPRPPLPYEVEQYQPRARQRLRAKPGITGLWQVSGRNQTTFDEMIDLDIDYVDRWSIVLDLQILLRTFPVVLFPDGH